MPKSAVSSNAIKDETVEERNVAMQNAGLQLGLRVSVWSHEEGTWLDGAVTEINIAAGSCLP